MAARERLELPYSKGWIDFVDLNDITGGDVRRIRNARGGTAGEMVNGMAAAAAAAFIAAWEIPGKDLPLPRRDPLAIEKLHYADLYVLEKAVGDLWDQVSEGRLDQAAGSPPPPATD